MQNIFNAQTARLSKEFLAKLNLKYNISQLSYYIIFSF